MKNLTKALLCSTIAAFPCLGVALASEHLAKNVREQLPTELCSYLDNLPRIEPVEEVLKIPENLLCSGKLDIEGALKHEETIKIPEKSEKIVQFLKKFIPQKKNLQLDGDDALALKIANRMIKNEEILMRMTGFPFKSTNTVTKVIDHKVDVGELVGILTLNHMTQEIAKIYKPGAKITIFSDGIVYQDILEVTDEIFDNYQMTMKKIIEPFEKHIEFKGSELKEDYLKHFKMNGVAKSEIDPVRLTEFTLFAKEELEGGGGNNAFKFRGFFESTNKIPLTSEKLGEFLIRASESFSKFLEHHIPGVGDYIRLSIHADSEMDISKKLPIGLTVGSRGTPWHQMLLLLPEKGEILSCKREDVRNLFKIKESLTEKKLQKQERRPEGKRTPQSLWESSGRLLFDWNETLKKETKFSGPIVKSFSFNSVDLAYCTEQK